jgi:hypothetical protein
MATKKPTAAYLTQAPDLDLDAGLAYLNSPIPGAPEGGKPKEASGLMRRALGDTAASFGQGAVQGVRLLTDLAGADNAVSTGLRTVEDFIGGLKSAEAKADQEEMAAILREAEGKGVLDQVVAGFRAFKVAPVQTLAQALGTSVPTVATALIPGGQAAAGARMAAALGLGAGQGAGGVKSSIYDEVKQAELQRGATPEQAEAAAAKAQAYTGDNAGQIALGAGLGAWAGRSGIEGAAERLIHGSTKAVPGRVGRVAMGAAAEGIPEAIQGGQEKYATNTALNSAGFPTDPWAGVVANATMEGLAGAGMGGALGLPTPAQAPAPKPGDELRKDKLPESGPMTKALNAAVEAAAQKADAGQPIPADPATGNVTAPAPAQAPAATTEAPPVDFEQVLANMTELANRVGPLPEPIDQATPESLDDFPDFDPAAELLPGDILDERNQPFKSRVQAMRTAKEAAAEYGMEYAVEPVWGGKYFVVRPVDAADDTSMEWTDDEQRPDVPGTAAAPAGPAAGPSADELGSQGAVGSVPAAPEQRVPGAEGTAASGEPAAAVAPGVPDDAPLTGSWALDNARATVEAIRARNPKLLEQVEELHAQDMTAGQIAQQLGVDADLVRDLRNGLGLPNQGKPSGSVAMTVPGDAEERAKFEDWRRNRKAAQQQAAPAPAASTPTRPALADRWNSMDGTGRLEVLTSAGWVGGASSKSAQKAMARAWDQLTDSQRERISAAMEAPSATEQQAPEAPAGEAATPGAVGAPAAPAAGATGARPAAVEADGVKERWQMTRAEHLVHSTEVLRKKRGGELTWRPGPGYAGSELSFQQRANAAHREHVQKALSEGKDVPAAVRAEYPGLEQPAKDRATTEKSGPATPAESKPDQETPQAQAGGTPAEGAGGSRPAPAAPSTDSVAEGLTEALAKIATSRSGAKETEKKLRALGYVRTANDGWTSLTPSGWKHLQDSGYSLEGGKYKKATAPATGNVSTEPEAAPLDAELQDALGKLGDVLGDVFGAKKNITGPQYGAADLLPALSKVVELLVRKGFKSFAQATTKAAAIMRANAATAPHVDAISPRQWKAAYNAIAEGHAGTDSEEAVAALSAEDVRGMVGEVKPAADDNKPKLAAPNGRLAVAQSLADHMIGGNKFATIIEARKFIAELTGEKIEPGTRQAKQADETVEMAVVMAARDIVRGGRAQGRDDATIFKRLVSLYDAQPGLNVRDSDSIREQAYSTPAPLAFAASRLAGIKRGDKVGEPTAGNGMLVMEVGKDDATLNELNSARAANLESMGFKVSNRNAAGHPLAPAKSLDAVVMNPPFGVVRGEDGKTVTYDVGPNYTTGEVDHAIVFKALESMKDDGNAVLIIGGTLAESDDGRRDAYRGKAKREFFYNLHAAYNVVDHFTIGGDLYKKQGTTYPVDVIVIRGRGKASRSLPAASLPPIISTWAELQGKLNEQLEGMGSEGAGDAGGRRGQDGGTAEPAGVLESPGVPAQGAGRGSDTGGAGASQQPADGGRAAGPAAGGGTSRDPAAVGEPGNASASDGGRLAGRPAGAGANPEGRPAGAQRAGGNDAERLGDGGGRVERTRLSEDEAGRLQVKYSNFSGNRSVNTLVATGHLSALENAFERLRARVGNIDAYVRERLQYDEAGFKKAFSAEQVEALALAIDNIEQGRGFIIGDQTGIGKGRVVAAMIRYAKLSGKTPVFVTQMPDLYGDMMRDLNDIGMGDFKPLMTNNDAEVPLDAEALSWFSEVQGTNTQIRALEQAIEDLVLEQAGEEMTAEELTVAVRAAMKATDNPEILSLRNEIAELKASRPKRRGRFLETPPLEKHEKALADLVAKGGIGDYGAIFTTYNQMAALDSGKPRRDKDGNKQAPKPPTFAYRDTFLRAMVNSNAMLILDESHNAGAAGDGRFPKVGDVVRDLVRASGSVFYSSATFAKNPLVMDVYSRTDLGRAFTSATELAEAIQTVPQQQVASAMLVEAGQYIRRERSFDGIEYKTDTVDVDQQAAEDVSTAMRLVVEFDEAKRGAIKNIQNELDAEGAMIASTNGGMSAGSVESTNFTSVMHNVINTFLLALKADAAADRAIEAIRAGEKPVLTVANTMEMFIADYAKSAGLGAGSTLDATFADVLQRYLEKTRMARIKHANGLEEVLRLSDKELGPDAVFAYESAAEFIKQLQLSIPLSPIDHIKERIKAAGFSIGEVTGRQMVVEGGILRPRNKAELNTAGKKNTIAKFNGGQIDALIINRSGSTGLSMHASETFSDQRRRVMVIAQAELDINNHMQMLGRTNRTGQVTTPPAVLPKGPATYGLPRYAQLTANVPIELRPAAVLAAKMANLSANTTAGRRSAVEDSSALDFINKYGDSVAALIVGGDPDLNRRLGWPVRVDDDGLPSAQGAIAKVTGRIGLLPMAEQTEIYERIASEYRDLIAQLDALGTNDLEAKTYPLEAKTLESTEVVAGDGDSPFTSAVVAEKVEVRKLGKPYTSAKVRELVAAALDGQTADQLYTRTIDNFRREVAAELTALRLQAASDPKAKANAERRIAALETARARFVTNVPRIGSPVVIKTSGGNIYGIPIGFTHKKGAKSVSALSSWRLEIAVVDGSRVMRFPLSQVYANSDATVSDNSVIVQPASTMNVVNADRTGFDEIPVLDAFDRGQTDAREVRTVMTGNLLRAGAMFPGRLMSFTTADGSVRQGLMTPASFDLTAAQAKMTPALTDPAKIVEFMERGGEVVDRATGGENLKARKTHRFEVSTGKTGPGKKIATDGGLYMVSAGNRMRAAHSTTAAELREFFGRVLAMGVQLTTTPGTKGKVEGPKLKRGTNPDGRLDFASAKQLADGMAAQGLVRLNVVKSVADMPARQRDKVLALDPDGQMRGAYFRQGDSIWMVADNIRGADQFVQIAFHEAFHRGLALTIPEAKPLLREMWRTNQALRKATKAQMDAHGIGKDEAIEEALAVMAEAGTVRDLKGWPKLLELIRGWLGKVAGAVGVKMTWTDDMVLDFVAAMTGRGLKGGVHVNTGEDVKLQRAWHGTPHRGIDKFSTDKVGTGEGAQAYGWGLYFASKREVAEWYRENLTGRDNGKRLEIQGTHTPAQQEAANLFADYFADSDYENFADVDRGQLDGWATIAQDDGVSAAVVDALRSLDVSKLREPTGQVYEVEIPEDTDMLLWDKPVPDETLRKVAEASVARGLIGDVDEALDLLEQVDRRGELLYMGLSEQLGSDRAASQFLYDLGIKGIKYLDGNSRDGKGSTYNYVIFSGDDVAVKSQAGTDQTDTPAFRRWFGDSKVVDAEGKPLVVYHGTDADFATFDPARMGTKTDDGMFGRGFYFSPNHGNGTKWAGTAGAYAASNDGGNIMPVYLKMERPLIVPSADYGRVSIDQEKYDGVIVEEATRGQRGPVLEYVVFGSEQIKSAIGNRGTFDPENPDIRFSRATPVAQAVQQTAHDLLKSQRTFNWWHRTVGTQFHKAEQHAGYKRVYDKAQEYLSDTSAFANDPADLAPSVLPQVKTFADLKRSLSLGKDDRDKLGAAVFQGTLSFTRGENGEVLEAGDAAENAGVVWTPEELRQRFGMDDRQIGMYQEYRAAVNRSLDILTAADVARFLGDDLPAGMKAMISEGDVNRFRGLVSAHTTNQRTAAEKALADMRKRHRAEMGAHWRKQKATLEGPQGRAGSRLAALEDLDRAKNAMKLRHGGEKYRAEQLAKKWSDLDDQRREKFERVDDLKARGYAPLMRFGRYAVDVKDGEGNRLYFGLYETEREANAAARDLGEKFADADPQVSQGVLSEDAYKQFSGMTPETLELFAELVGVEKTDLFQEYLRAAKNNRSALRRLIKRQGTAGYSEDASRVLASFITSNARAASSSLHMGDLTTAVEGIDKSQGDVKDEAIRLREYVQNPQDEGQTIRSILFAQYLGGSIASAMVNLTQPLMMTLPYLSQFGGPVAAGRRMAGALKVALSGATPGSALAKAMYQAEKEGVVSPQELHQLQAEANSALSRHPALRRWSFLWGSLFSLAEQFNRRISFAAAYQTGVETGQADPYAFAVRSVDQTQGVYTKANRPNWARGAVGATVFTFKQYSISYVEFLKRLPKREQALALAILLLAAGANGLPGADDLDDLIDTFGQHLGYDTNAKLWKARVLEDAMGKPLANFMLHGFSALPGVPLDVAGRLGLGNLIPGTAVLRKDVKDKGAEFLEVLGPAGSTAMNTIKAVPLLANGEFMAAADVAGSTAGKNLRKAIEMYQTGEYRDTKGRKVVDVDGYDAIIKGIGFQPAHVAESSRKAQMARQQISLAKNVEAEIADAIAQARVDGKPEKERSARERLRDWNRDNPASPISINTAQIIRRVREMRRTRDERLAKTAPREMRQGAKEVLQ